MTTAHAFTYVYPDLEPAMEDPKPRPIQEWDLRAVTHVWTEADLETLPEDGHRYEIIDGGLTVTPPTSDRHQRMGYRIAGILNAAAPPGWEALPELGIRVPGGNLIPDVVLLRPGAAENVVWREAGDVALVVEVASPSTETHDRGDKLVKYAQAGIPAYWRIAADGTVTVHHLDDNGAYRTTATVKPGETWDTDTPFPVTIDPAALTARI